MSTNQIVNITTAFKQMAHGGFWISLTFLVVEIVKIFASVGNGPTMLVF